MPLLTIVIPTHDRPHFLERAIKSALTAAPSDCVEVVVVPNGGGGEWVSVKNAFLSDVRVRWFPLECAGVSKARNHGLANARGEFVRFLDDDDYFYSEACQKQYFMLLSTGADICSGGIDITSSNGVVFKIWAQPNSSDFCSAMLSPNRRVQVGGHLFRREVLSGAKWNESQSLNEDMEWVLGLCGARELRWVRMDESVAVWTQHTGSRLSRGRDPGDKTLKYSAEMIIRTAKELELMGRFGSARQVAAANGLWALLQKGLRYDKQYWRNIADIADSYSCGRRPPSVIHRMPVFRYIPPLTLEFMLIPFRVAYQPVRRLLDVWGISRV